MARFQFQVLKSIEENLGLILDHATQRGWDLVSHCLQPMVVGKVQPQMVMLYNMIFRKPWTAGTEPDAPLTSTLPGLKRPMDETGEQNGGEEDPPQRGPRLLTR